MWVVAMLAFITHSWTLAMSEMIESAAVARSACAPIALDVRR
jgi:hypothetical protein